LLLWQFYTSHIAPSAASEHNVTQQACNSQSSTTESVAESGEPTNSEKKAVSSGNGETDSDVPTSVSCDSSQAASIKSSGAGVADFSGLRPYHELLGGRNINFRATCTRHGRKHSFTSQEAAKHFGAGLAQYFGWKVKLKQPDIEVLLDISGDSATVGLALTREAKFRRNIAQFGPTTLRATIAYGLLRCADIQPGDIVLDPLCGGGSINIEGSLAWPDTYHIAGDLHDLAVPRVAANVFSLLQQRENRRDVASMKVDVCQWDVCNLPLRTASVDVIVTDMPFGKKSGSRTANWELYPKALSEMARVCRPHSGRAVLLTHDNKALSKSVQRDVFWKRIKTLWVNVGGLEAALYILHRSSMPFYS
jgi:tRNA G10  N-methylase Trm11